MILIVIIGAGMAGMACARRLADAGHAPVVLDKGRGIGGRMATRRIGDLRIDHGAQYVNAHRAGFVAMLDRLGGAVAEWRHISGRTHTRSQAGNHQRYQNWRRGFP
jgi:renalase